MATGKDVNGGYAEYMTADEKYAHAIPNFFSDSEAAPLLCAGAIGYRSVQLAQIKDGDHVGLTGFGASAHLVLKMLRYSYPKAKIVVFARKEAERVFAMELGRRYLKCLPGKIGLYYRYHTGLETCGGSACQSEKRGQIGNQCHSKRGKR
jgi:D-arabinose 1-dehydrogenase-like Zn-dependent alcohol dehydrogenase